MPDGFCINPRTNNNFLGGWVIEQQDWANFKSLFDPSISSLLGYNITSAQGVRQCHVRCFGGTKNVVLSCNILNFFGSVDKNKYFIPRKKFMHHIRDLLKATTSGPHQFSLHC